MFQDTTSSDGDVLAALPLLRNPETRWDDGVRHT